MESHQGNTISKNQLQTFLSVMFLSSKFTFWGETAMCPSEESVCMTLFGRLHAKADD